MNEDATRPSVVTMGETMGTLRTPVAGPLGHASSLTLGIGGSESNVAIALRRLGVDATWIGKVGSDALGDLVEREIRAEGVRVEVIRDADEPTGLLLKERRTVASTRVWYYRRGSAGSRLRADEIDPELIREASLLHVTGVSLAASPQLAEAVTAAVAIAVGAGVPVSFDLNHRARLWSTAQAAAAYRAILPSVDVVFGGDEEAAIAVGASGEPMELAHALRGLGARDAVVKLGARGAVGVVGGEEYVRAAVDVPIVDSVGAGDAFVAGYLAEQVAARPPRERFDTAVRVAAFVCQTDDDWQGSPRRDELELLDRTENVRR